MSIIGNLGGVERESGPETRMAFERVLKMIEELKGPEPGTDPGGAPTASQAPAPAPRSGSLLTSPARRYAASIQSSTCWAVPASVHGFNTPALHVVCYDSAGKLIEPDRVVINPANLSVAVFWTVAQQGTICII